MTRLRLGNPKLVETEFGNRQPAEFVNHKLLEAINAVSADQAPIIEIFRTIEGEGNHIGTPRVLVRFGGCAVGCHWCLALDQHILTPSGKKLAGELKEGDWLYTFDNNFKIVKTQIKEILKRKVKSSKIVKVTYQAPVQGRTVTKSIRLTADHQVNVKGRGWIAAGDLKPFDVIYHIDEIELNGHVMRDKNPMHDRKTAAQVGRSLRTKYQNGEWPEYVMTKARAVACAHNIERAKEGARRRMLSDNNPMKDPAIAMRMGRATKAAYRSGERIPYVRSKKLRKAESVRMRRNNPMHDPKIVRKVIANKRYSKSKLERTVHNLIRRNELPVVYTGTRMDEYAIGNSKLGYKVPDFKVRGKRKLIEVYDPTFPFYADDRKGRNNKQGCKRYEEKKAAHFARFGFETLFIKSTELRNRDKLANKIGQFAYNGAVVKSVKRCTPRDLISFNRKYEGGNAKTKVTVINFSCAPYNHFIVQGLHLHNCDTPHSWAIKTASVLQSLDAIETQIIEVAKGYVKEVSFTGGEPMHYPRQLLELTQRLRRKGFRLSVETSGLVFNHEVFLSLDYVSMDIKTPSAKVPVTSEMIREYKHMLDTYDGVQFKCVILNKEDLAWVDKHLGRFFKSDAKVRRPLILTPGVVATKKEANLAQALADVCSMILDWNKGYNVRIIAQQHALMNYR